ncbi:MAG TPA: thiamine pyrophosphate-dependent enzyme [Vicinamibacterales bacterium]|nr:thiamine pyrophosphate-dependent enzyme [Vicinamibacterales bacterium]
MNRRGFLKHASLAGAAAIATPAVAEPQSPAARGAAPATPIMSAAAETATPPEAEILTTDRTGSDFMVDVLKAIGLDYICANPGSSFRGIHESVINYGGNERPELITCCHEESSVAMGHGYAKVEGKPLGVFAHGTVGLQHAAMAIYNAWCDRVPVYVMLGNQLDATLRRPGAEWAHSVQDAAAMVRDFTKWDDTPMSLPHFAESALRAYKIAMTPPMAPVVLVLNAELQEQPLGTDVRLAIPKLAIPAPPEGDSRAVAEVARLLVAAEHPVIVADRYARTPAAMAHLVELAETLQAGVISLGGRLNFPTRHPLNVSQARAIADADLILALEVNDLWGVVNTFRDQLHRSSRPLTRPGTKVISITSGDLYLKANYQDFQRFAEVDLALAADAEATLPSLVDAVKRTATADRRRVFESRGAKLAEATSAALDRARLEASYAWDASPVSTARLCAELWGQIRNEDWALVNGTAGWAPRLWSFDKPYQFIGGSGGAGVGYGAPAAVGAALAHKRHGRLAVNIQTDGDLMYAPGVLWTAAHHRIPLLSVMHNNRAYHQELMHVQKMCNRHSRGVDRGRIGSELVDPFIDYAKVAQGLGLHAEGPITDPKDVGPAIARAVATVKRGEPALVDVVCQPR